jgi:hypothetical protein
MEVETVPVAVVRETRLEILEAASFRRRMFRRPGRQTDRE